MSAVGLMWAKFDFGMINGVRICLWSCCFLYCLKPPWIRMLLWNHFGETWGRGRRSWRVNIRRNFNDWEIDVMASFCHLLDSHIPTREGSDRMRWKLVSLFLWVFTGFTIDVLPIGKKFGEARLQGGFLSLCGQRLGGKLLPARTSSWGVTQWWVGVVRVVLVGRPWITSWLIVMWPKF